MSWGGTPALIVAGGPSLDKNIDRLPELRKHALLIAVDTVLDRLVEMGILPDLVVSVDSSELNLKHFKKDSYPGVRLAMDPEAYPVYDRFGDAVVAFATDRAPFFHWLDSFLGPKGVVTKGVMVSQTAFHLAGYWGCDPIIFMGQDLALDPDSGQTHHSGAALLRKIRWIEDDPNHAEYLPINENDTETKKEILWVPGAVGDQVPTLEKLRTYLRIVESDVARSNAQVIDATEGGALIAGTDIISADKVFDIIKHKNFNFESFWNWLGSQKSSNQNTYTDALREIQARMDVCAQSAEMAGGMLDMGAEAGLFFGDLMPQFEPLRWGVFDDPVVNYFIEHLASSTLFEFFKLGPADAQGDCEHKETSRRHLGLIAAVRETVEWFNERSHDFS